VSERRHLCIAAFWVEGDPREATDGLADAIPSTPGFLAGTGSVVTIDEHNVDAALRRWLRNIDIAEAADAADGRMKYRTIVADQAAS